MPNRIMIENTRRPHTDLWDGKYATTQVNYHLVTEKKAIA